MRLLKDNPRDRDDFESFDLTEEDRELLVSELYFNHLPEVGAAGFIDWNCETNTITRGPRFDEIAPLLRLMDELRRQSFGCGDECLWSVGPPQNPFNAV